MFTKSKKISFISLYIILLLIFTYLILLLSDLFFFISDQKKYYSFQLNKIQNKENKQLIENKYKKLFVPNEALFDNRILKLSQKYKFVPLGTFPTTKTIFCDEGYGLINYKSDSLGLRNSDKVFNTYPYKAIILGDSNIQGACVKNQTDLSSLLNNKFNGGFLNLGHVSNQQSQYYLQINEFTQPKAPKNIILFLTEANDLDNTSNFKFFENQKNINYPFSKELNHHILNKESKRFYNDLNFLYQDFNNTNEKISFLLFLKNNFNFKSNLKLSNLRVRAKYKFLLLFDRENLCLGDYCLIGETKNYYQKKFNQLDKVINLILKKCIASECNSYIFLIPFDRNKNSQNNFMINFYDHKLLFFEKYIQKKITNIRNISYLNLNRIINPYDPSYFSPKTGGHLSIKSHKIIADYLGKILNF